MKILILGIILSILIRGLIIFNGLEVADIKNFHDSANMLLSGINPYLNAHLYPYPPLWMFFQAGSAVLAQMFHTSFHFVMKFWPNLADVLIAILIYKKIRSKLWSFFYLFNPVSLIISSAHGQFDSIGSSLTIFSIIFTNPLFLGLAISLKAYPAMLLPLFIFSQKIWQRKLRFLIFASLPTGLLLIPFLVLNSKETISAIFSYSGFGDLGYGAVLRSFWWQINAEHWLPQSDQLLSFSKISFLAGSIFFYITFSGGKNLIKGCLAVYLLFLAVYFGISAQYLLWVLPLAVLSKDKMVIPYSIVATLALSGFYLFFGPEILLGKYFYLAGGFFQNKFMPLYFFGNLMLWLTILFWLVKIVKEQLPEVQKFSPVRKKLVIASILVFIISLLPLTSSAIQIIRKSVF